MNASTKPANHIRFEFRAVLVCLLACVGALGPGADARGQDLAGDKQALVALYNATDGENWVNNENWLSDESVGRWHGVTVSDGRVTGLSLLSNQLTGTIPSELGKLSSLTWLQLLDNQLTGTIPPELGMLSSLTFLALSANQLTGPIPPELGQLSSLEGLRLSENALTGPIPPELGQLSRLERLELYENALTGPIPPELGKLSSLTRLQLLHNQLTGTIPPELGMLSSLTFLDLLDNQLTGTIPPELGMLSSLTWLQLNFNQLTGSIPPELGKLSSLENLDLAGNQLTGPIPPKLGQLSHLERLWLSNNGLTGPIPPELGQPSGLTELSLWGNQLTGLIPPELGQLSRLERLYLSNNQLTGPIPSELGQLSGLTELYLWGNQLTGPIPAWVGQLSRLERLWLSNNGLTGPIPPELGQLSGLTELSLWGNQLTGPIPPELGQLSRLQWLYLSNNGLTGPIPPELGQLSGLTELSLRGNQLTGPIPAWVGQLSHLERLRLSNNGLTGPIPPELGQLSSVKGLLLHNNQLTGPIPPELGQLSSVERLLLHNNQLTGPIPPELGRLSRLQWLSLSCNALTGPIPPELGQLSSLTRLDLSCNQLTGPIPAWMGQLSRLERLGLSNNGLTGPIPPELGQLFELRVLHLQHNRLTGEIPPALGQLSNLEEFSFRGNRLTGVVPAGLSHLPDVYVLNLRASRLAPDRIMATWDDPGDPHATYEYRLRDETDAWTEWTPIEDSATMLKRGKGVTIEWTLAGLRADRDYQRIGIRISNATGQTTVEAPVTAPVTPVVPEPEGEESLFVPVLLTSAGRSNALFTSELTLTNRGSEEATLHYTYTAHAGGGSGTATDTLPPGGQRIQSDAIGYLTGLGIPIPGSGNRVGTLRVGISGSSEVSVVTRTTTAVPEGRAGLAYPGIGEDEGFQEAVYLCGLRENTQDRSNVAVQNAGDSSGGDLTLRVTVFSGDSAAPGRSVVLPDLSLPPGGFHQYNGILKRAGFDHGYVKVERVAGEARFYAYGVINDNFNSDGSFVFPVTEGSLVGRSGQTLPVIIETGAFQSELTLTNFSRVAKTVNFRFVADAVDASDDTATFSLRLEAGQQAILPNVVNHLRQQGVAGIGPAGGTFVGALFATPVEGDMSGIVMGARTGSPDGRGGQYSLFYNGVPYGSASLESAWIYGLQQNRENRSNLALVNTGEIDDSSSTFEITVYDGAGDSEPRTRSVTVRARRWTQINGILGDISQGYVQVRKTSGNNPFVAYGVINDGGRPGERSGDGAYLPAQP